MHSTAAVARAQARSPRRTSATEKEGPFIQTRQLAQERKSRGLWASNESIGRLVQQKTLRHSSGDLRLNKTVFHPGWVLTGKIPS